MSEYADLTASTNALFLRQDLNSTELSAVTNGGKFIYQSNITTLADGRYLLILTHTPQTGQWYLEALIFDAAGIALGAPFRIDPGSSQAIVFSPHTVPLADGGWVTAWSGTGGGRVLRFDDNGNPIGSPGPLSNIVVDGLVPFGDGGWTVVSHSQTYGPGASYTFTRSNFDALGNLVGSSQFTESGIIAGAEAVATSDGGSVIQWLEYRNLLGGDPNKDLYVRHYDNDGAASDVVKVDPLGSDHFAMTTQPLTDGGWISMWMAAPSQPGVFAQRFSADGSAAGDVFRVSDHPERSAGTGAVINLPDGWMITWQTDTTTRAQRYGADGQPMGQAFDFGFGTLSPYTFTYGSNGDGNVLLVTLAADLLGAYGAYTSVVEPANVGHMGDDERFIGTGQDDHVRAGAGNDELLGLDGDDRLAGEGGDDLILGGVGVDTADYADAEAGVTVRLELRIRQHTVGAGWDTLADIENITGSSFNDTLSGDGAVNFLAGGDGDDRLDGRGGADLMLGGGGNDAYAVDHVGDVVSEESSPGVDAGGVDFVGSSVSHTLSTYVENLSLIGTAAIDGTGNDLANKIAGNGAANVLTGADGNDALTGAGGADVLSGGGGDDALSGGADDDDLSGGSGADKLDGGTGADILAGGDGNDVYTVDDLGDRVSEEASPGVDAGGVDLVYSSVGFALGAFVENLTLTGSAAIDGVGNALANRLAGNSAANQLWGGDGADTLSGAAGEDVLNGGEGNDSLSGGTEADALNGGAGDDTLSGGAGNDSLSGGSGGDKLDGGEGADTLAGGDGNDTYVVDDSGDFISEEASPGVDAGGVDLANASVSFTLSRFVENLTLTGATSIDGTGNAQANKIVGNAGDNRLSGLAGDDSLYGGLGNDWLEGGGGKDGLSGGLGADIFVFGLPEPSGADRITDFVGGTDKIGLRASAFSLEVGQGLLADGRLDPDWFIGGPKAVSVAAGHGQFVFDSTTRTLSWDADGAGGLAAVAMAVLNTPLTADDFLAV